MFEKKPAPFDSTILATRGKSGEQKKYKILYNRNKCVGADVCTPIAPHLVVLNPADNKVDLIGGKETEPGIFELVVEEDVRDVRNEAKCMCDSCPAAAFRAIDMETNEKVAGR